MKPEKIYGGLISWFGGPRDLPDKHGKGGVQWDEDVALYGRLEAHNFPELFMPSSDAFAATPVDRREEGPIGLARRLIPEALYCAMRWDYSITSRAMLRSSLVECWPSAHPDRKIALRPVDWGPNDYTGRIIDVSFGAMQQMGITTNDLVECRLVPWVEFTAWSVDG